MFSRNEKKTDAKFDINSDIKTCSSIIFHSKLQQKCHFGQHASGRCGQIKIFGVNIVSVFKTSENKLVWLISLNHSFFFHLYLKSVCAK